MRLIKISSPEGTGESIARTAFAVGIRRVSMHSGILYLSDDSVRSRDVVDIETSTPRAKEFIDRLLTEDYYDPAEITINTRQPRSIISDESIAELTSPLPEPPTDLYQELWQFSRVTYGLVGRIFLAACLLAYGMIEGRSLLMVGGLLFLPIVPMAMATSYGITGRQWKLVKQGLFSFAVANVVLAAGGAFTALISGPPIRFEGFGSPIQGVLISIVVGVAAALAAMDDAGRRELIGLAAASQLAIIPVWLGIVAIFGPPAGADGGVITDRGLAFLANFVALVVSMMITQYVTDVAGEVRNLGERNPAAGG